MLLNYEAGENKCTYDSQEKKICFWIYAYSFHATRETQIASDPIYITLHISWLPFDKEVPDHSSSVYLPPKRQDGNHSGKQLPTLLLKITRGRGFVSVSVPNISRSAIRIQNLTHRILPATIEWWTSLHPNYFQIINFNTGNSHLWLKFILHLI